MIKVTFFRTLGSQKVRAGHLQFGTINGMALFMGDGARALIGYDSFVIHDGKAEYNNVQDAIEANK